MSSFFGHDHHTHERLPPCCSTLDNARCCCCCTSVFIVAHLLGLPSLTDRTVVALRAVASDPRRVVTAALVSPEYLTN